MAVVTKQEVVEDWSVLIGGGQGSAEQLLADAQVLIDQSKAPAIKMQTRNMAPSLVRGLMGGRRPFLVVSNTTSAHLKPYKMYINARDYGNNLDIAWYLVWQPGFWRRFFGFLLAIPLLNLVVLTTFFPYILLARLGRGGKEGLFDLDLFDQQDLRAYVTNAHHCVLRAVDAVVYGLGQEPSKIDRKSRGFLGIS